MTEVFAHLSTLVNQKEDLAKFYQYRDLLYEANQRMNLTTITAEKEVELKHFFDSLLLLGIREWNGSGKVADIGSGAGFPGIPVKIVCPDISLSLLDASAKKVAFLQDVIGQLALPQAAAFHLRAEEAGRLSEHRQSYDWVLSRGLAPLPVLLEYALPLLRQGGYFVAYKGPGGRKESLLAEKVALQLGGRLQSIYEDDLPEGQGQRQLLLYLKTGITPGQFPRRPGMPAKCPL